MNPVTVVHLARHANGPTVLREFVDSYLRFDAGIPHEMVVICKGFHKDHDVQLEFERIGRPIRVFPISDAGFDVGAYVASLKIVQTELVCLLNSFSTIQASGWLAKLAGAVQAPGVGVAGATGSWESTFSAAVSDAIASRSFPKRPRMLATMLLRLGDAAYKFPSWPNPHIRTNAFVIRTTLFKRLAFKRDDRKSALLFESGYQSLTRQLSKQGLRAVVAGADGRTFDMESWPDSATFRSHGQRNLLVQDNQTRRYQLAGPDERMRLGKLAWRERYSQ